MKFLGISLQHSFDGHRARDTSFFSIVSLQHFNVLLFSVPMFPFSHHSFQTDPQAEYSRKFENFWISDKLILNSSKISLIQTDLLPFSEFWFSWFSTDSKNSDRTLIWIIRMVRSLADRTFQLRSCRASRIRPGGGGALRSPLTRRVTWHKQSGTWALRSRKSRLRKPRWTRSRRPFMRSQSLYPKFAQRRPSCRKP